jgi:hypothetical protein
MLSLLGACLAAGALYALHALVAIRRAASGIGCVLSAALARDAMRHSS